MFVFFAYRGSNVNAPQDRIVSRITERRAGYSSTWFGIKGPWKVESSKNEDCQKDSLALKYQLYLPPIE